MNRNAKVSRLLQVVDAPKFIDRTRQRLDICWRMSWRRFGSLALMFAGGTLGLFSCAVAPAQDCIHWAQRTDVGSPGQRSHHAMAYDSDRSVTVLFGGEIGQTGSKTYLQGTQEYDGSAWKQVNIIGSEPPGRSYHAMVYDPVGKRVLLFGGSNGGIPDFDDLWAYTGTGTNGVWTKLADQSLGQFSFEGVAAHGMVWDKSRNVLIMQMGLWGGGVNNGAFGGGTYEWNGTGWALQPWSIPLGLAHPGSADGLYGFGMVYDSTRQLAMTIGGFLDLKEQGFITDVYEYTAGSGWAGGAFLTSGRGEPAAAYDSSRQRVVVVGGDGALATTGEQCFEFDSLQPQLGWAGITDLPSGMGRAAAAMVYDSARQVMVLMGGAGGGAPNASSGGAYSDTWELAPILFSLGFTSPGPGQILCQSGPLVINAYPTDNRPLNYQWYLDGAVIPGQTSNILNLPYNPYVGIHNFVLVATDMCHNQQSTPPIPLTIHSAPQVNSTSLQGSFQQCPGGSIAVTCSVQDDLASPSLPTSYQWFHDGNALMGADQPTLTLTNLQHTDSGYYYVEASNTCGSSGGVPVFLQVGVTISANPVAVTTQVCQSAVFTVQAAGVGTLRYQWRLDGAALANGPYVFGADSSTLVRQPLLYSHEGNYDVVITDDCGPQNSVTSSVAHLTILPGPEWVLRTTNGPTARTQGAMAYDSSRGVTMSFGGLGLYQGFSNQLVVLNELWEWNGSVWVQRMTESMTNGWGQDARGYWTPSYQGGQPVHRYADAMAYDSNRGRVVLFGGRGPDPDGFDTLFGDTWEWDGAQWYFRATNGPAPRASHTMAYDQARGVTVLYGGTAISNDYNIVWEWDGNSWKGNAQITGPATNYVHTVGGMVYDSFRKYAFFGPSYEGNGPLLFWGWNGASWTSLGQGLTPGFPTPTYGGMVFDSYRRREVFFGGDYLGVATAPTNTTAFWDGLSWTLLASNGPVPAPRANPAMAYDSGRHATVMMGGQPDGSGQNLVANETWELLAVDVPLVNEQPPTQYRQPGDTAIFYVTAIGHPGATLTYSWSKDGTVLNDGGRVSGSATSRLQITDVAAADAGVYTAQVSCDCGSIVTLPAILTLDPNLQVFKASTTGTLIWGATNVVLQQSGSIAGPWMTVPGATSPFNTAVLGPDKFFRLVNSGP